MMNKLKILLLTVGHVNYNCDINFFEPMKDMGQHVIRYNYLERLEKVGRRKMNREVLELARTEYPDYIFYITYRYEITKGTLKKLKNDRFKVVGWFSDDHWRFDDYSKDIAKYMFCSITTDKDALNKYRSSNLNVIKSQWASNSRYYLPVESNEKYDVTFVGQKYPPRGEIINFLQNHDVPIRTFGRDWNNFVSNEELVSIFSNSRINLNISASSQDINVKQIKGRVFEVPMSSGFLLTDYAEGLEDYFEIGKEIVCYEDEHDLLSKIKYYLEHDEERAEIARNGYKAALERNTWERRFDDIFGKLDSTEWKEAKNDGLIARLKNVLFSVLKIKAQDYDKKFYEFCVNKYGAFAEELIPVLIDMYDPASVVDVGCGAAMYLAAFHKRGVKVKGYEGSQAALKYGLLSPEHIELYDLKNGLQSYTRYDLCLCIEVAEHIPLEKTDILVKSLCNLSDRIIFTAAQLGQGGLNHINEQPPEFWIERFEKFGLKFNKSDRDRLKEKILTFVSYRDDNFFFKNLLVFEKDAN